MARKTVIPPGYTFLSHDTFLSIKAKDLYQDLVTKAANRNPDAFDMYIYNDFYSYAVLDLVDRTLTTAHTKVTKKAYDDAYCILEGLALFNDYDLSWPMCDDGERTKITDKAYGALVVAMLRGFEAGGKLNTTHLPGLEGFLKVTAEWSDQMRRLSCAGAYGAYCKALAREIVGGKTPEDFAREKAWLNEWIAGLSEEDQEIAREHLRDAAEDEAAAKTKPKAWYADVGEADEDDLILSRVWKKYKAYQALVPNRPARGPGTWDISKWTAEQKKEFVFEGPSDEESS